MQPPLDPASPVPLYHQLAEALRYRIATGALAPGAVLPSLREAAGQWGVNLHTVRHAYAALAELGLVRTEGPRGTVVLGGGAAATVARSVGVPATRPGAATRSGAARAALARGTRGDPDAGRRAADRFLAGVLREAHARFGLSAGEVGRRLALLDPAAGAAPEPVHVVECSESQAADLALQLGSRWNVAARGWSLERPGEPPPGPVVATYFHYNDIRTRWPERFPDVYFVAIHPDPALAARLAQFRDRLRDGGTERGRARRGEQAQGLGRVRGRTRGRTAVLVCERETAMARNIAADVRAILPADRFDVTARVESSPGAALAAAPSGTPLLFAPRVWAALSPARRADPRAMEIRYLIEPKDLAELGAVLGAAPAPALRSVPGRGASA